MTSLVIGVAHAISLLAAQYGATTQPHGVGRRSALMDAAVCKSFPARLQDGKNVFATNMTVSTVRGRSLVVTPSLVRVSNGKPENAPGTLSGALEITERRAVIETMFRRESRGNLEFDSESYPRLIFADGRMVGVLYAIAFNDHTSESFKSESALRFAPFEGGRWGAPLELARAKHFAWQPNFAGIAQYKATTWVVVPTDENSGVRSLLLLVYQKGRWRKSNIAPGGIPSTADVSFDGYGRPLIAFTAIDVKGAGANGSHPWLARIDTATLRTERTERIAWSGRASAAWVKFADSERRMFPSAFVVWGHQSAGHGGRDSIRFVHTTDEWKTFTSGEGVPVNGALFSLDAKVDEKGRIVVLAQTTSADSRDYRLTVVRVDAAGRPSRSFVAADGVFSLGHLAWVARRLSAIWLGTDSANSDQRFTHLRVAKLAECE